MKKRNRTRRLWLGYAVALALLPGVAASQTPNFTWRISASETDPNVNSVEFDSWTGFQFLYVWLIPGPGRDFVSSQFGLHVTGGLQIVSLEVINGFVTPTAPPQCGWWYVTFQCPTEPVAAARLGVVSFAPGAICPGDCYGENCSYDCSAEASQNSYVGFSSDGSTPCSFTSSDPCSPVSISSSPWGDVKARYRD